MSKQFVAGYAPVLCVACTLVVKAVTASEKGTWRSFFGLGKITEELDIYYWLMEPTYE
jgi:hypothetical protein